MWWLDVGRSYAAFRDGMLPGAGGMDAHNRAWLDLMFVLWAADSRRLREEREVQERAAEAQRRSMGGGGGLSPNVVETGGGVRATGRVVSRGKRG